MNRIYLLTLVLAIWAAGANVVLSALKYSLKEMEHFPATVEEPRSRIAGMQDNTVPAAEIKSSDADQ